MSYQDIIRKHPTEDEFKLARRIIKEAPDEVVKIVANCVAAERRLATLSAERAAFSPDRRETMDPDSRARLEEIMAGVKDEAVVYEKGKPPVEWEMLTRDQIRRRIAMLVAIRNGIDTTIERLTLLLDFLEVNGVDRYADLDKSPSRRRRQKAPTS